MSRSTGDFALFNVGVNHVNQLLGSTDGVRPRTTACLHEMRADVVFKYFGHEARSSAAHRRNHVHDPFAPSLLLQSALDSFDLAADPPDPDQELLFLSNGVRHGSSIHRIGGYGKKICIDNFKGTSWSPTEPNDMGDLNRGVDMRLVNKSRLFWIFALLGAWGAPAWAATGGSDLEEVTVSAKRLEEEIPQELEKYGTRVDAITTAQIVDGGYTDVAQALGTLAPGLYLTAKNGPFDYVDASYQGSRTEDILWLVDGVRINNRLYAGTTPLDTIPASMVERIEVIEGGQALFYGTQAVAGAVNIVTKAFADKADANVSLAADSNKGKHADGYARDAAGKNQFVVYVSGDQSDGFQPFRDQDYQPSGSNHRRDYSVLTLGGKYAYNFTDAIRFSVGEQHTTARLDFARPFQAYSEVNQRSEDLLTMKLDAKFSEKVELYVKPYYHWWQSWVTQYNNTIPPSGTLILLYDHAAWGYKDYGVNLLTKLRPGGAFEYFAGYDLQRYTGSDAALVITQHTESTNAVFAQVRTSSDLSTNLRLSLGLRYTSPSVGETATVWTVNGQYNINPNLYVRGQVGTSFRLPTTEELFANDPVDERGSPNLKPEKGTNTSLSVGGSLEPTGAKLSWEVIGFYRELKNLIDYATFDPVTQQAVFGNIPGTVRTRGGEITLNALMANWLSANANYTYASARDPATGTQISRVPKAVAKAGLDFHAPSSPWGATATLNYFGTTDRTGLWDGTESYGKTALMDISGRYFIDSARRQRIDVTVQNLFDKTYATGLGTGIRDSDGSPYTFWNLGVPRTLRISYSHAF